MNKQKTMGWGMCIIGLIMNCALLGIEQTPTVGFLGIGSCGVMLVGIAMVMGAK